MALVTGDKITAADHNALIASWNTADNGKVIFSGFTDPGFEGTIQSSFWIRNTELGISSFLCLRLLSAVELLI